jgi:2-methylcitrate dehydratase PrpD
MVKAVRGLGMETCATLGMLKEGQAEQLKSAGLDYYNHNLDTAPEFYGEIITTRTYDDRLDTLARVRRAGIKGVQPTHGWRHACATLMIAGGADVKTTQSRLGHSSPLITLALYVDKIDERDRAAGEALAAFMLGIEVVCRLSKAISVAPANGDIAWSQTGVTCGIGAALAAARLMQLDLGTARMAAGIAAAGASGIRALHGSMCTAALPAFAGQSGLRAALLAKGGFTATQSVIEARYGFAQCFAQTPHLAYLTDGLGTHWEILANTYKPFPCGIVIHPMIEAALEIAQELSTAAEAVARVEIIANPAAMALCYRRHPKDEMEGHVSLYHWVAAALARGKAGIPEGTDQAISDPAIWTLRDRIDVTSDPAVPHDGADVTVRLTNGASAARRVRACIGSRGRPMTNAELERKFAAAAEGVLPRSKIDAYLASIRGVETLGNARVLADGSLTA